MYIYINIYIYIYIRFWKNAVAICRVDSEERDNVISKGPTNASKYQCISTLVHCYMVQCFKEPSSGSSMWACWFVVQSGKSSTWWGLYIVTVPKHSPHPVLLILLWTTKQQAHIELPEDGALKRRNMQQWTNVLIHWYSMHLLILYLSYENAWYKL
jgi:hypothetical protein